MRSDFEPLLDFGGSEDILLNYSNSEFYNVIFNDNSRVDFFNVSYGVETNLQYPNVDITSIMFIEHSKYSYLISYNQQLPDAAGQRIVSVALDGESGQLLFYWDHEDNGLSIF